MVDFMVVEVVEVLVVVEDMIAVLYCAMYGFLFGGFLVGGGE